MRTAYQYKLLPNKEQATVIELWLEFLRRQYNYRLYERFSWWEENRCPVDACPMVMPITQLRDNPDYYSQKKDLVNTKDIVLLNKTGTLFQLKLLQGKKPLSQS
ncbi:helix-turn-helix domain-containing protein [Okeania sp. SIO2B3]|uniref:helix-turn-helix domain-containing protein n=1 Tax=Okeania sp. SIO2B3 TaxID=2607784 RepID=UPI00342D08E6